jgi:hypothetical protein
MNKLVDIGTMIVVVGGIMVLVRPNSQGPGLVDAFTRLFTYPLTVAVGSGVPAGFTPIPWGPTGR